MDPESPAPGIFAAVVIFLAVLALLARAALSIH